MNKLNRKEADIMHKDNRWLHGKHTFVAPPLSKNLKGATGCLFQEAIFDPKVGSEIYLAILEETDYLLSNQQIFPTRNLKKTRH